MELFWTQITDAQPARPARTKAHGSAWGVSLLAYAVRAVWGIDLPETAELPGGTLGFDVREIEDRQFLVTPRMFILRNVLVCLFFCYHDLSYQG